MRLNITSDLKFGTHLNDIVVPPALRRRISTNLEYVDAVYGGSGITPSTVTLFTGEAGAGKSTMLQLIGDGLSRSNCSVLFVSGEESPYQIKMQAERLRLGKGFALAVETDLRELMPQIIRMQARAEAAGQDYVVLVDSLQTLNDGKYGDTINSKTPERALQEITEFCKSTMACAIVVGQVNKGGTMAGSNTLKHMVDCHIHLSIESRDKELEGCRVLEANKNRFGSNNKAIFLALQERGFSVVATVTGS